MKMPRLDAEDKEALEVLGAWVLRGVVAVTTVMGSAVVLGLAWRVFEVVKG